MADILPKTEPKTDDSADAETRRLPPRAAAGNTAGLREHFR
ncbi:hypothetical protein [Nocardia sp. NPDC058480]